MRTTLAPKHHAMRSFFLVLLLPVFPVTASSFATSPTTLPSDPQAIYAALVGTWSGTLEYRDYQNDKRVTLPTLLEVAFLPDKSAVEFRYTYDDGPGKTVRDTDIVHISPYAKEYVVREKDGSSTTYHIEALEGFDTDRGGKLVLSGPGTENDKKVEVRTTVQIAPQSLKILRETKLAGEEFKFRHEYRFSRTEKP